MVSSIGGSSLSVFRPTPPSGVFRVTGRHGVENAAASGSSFESLRSIVDGLGKLRTSLERLRVIYDRQVRDGTHFQPATRQSTSPKAFTFESSYNTLRSTEEINTETSSFTPTNPTISGGSTATATIGGTYNGAQGDDTLTFKIKNNATIGSGDKLKIEITDSNGDKIQDDIDFQNNPAGNALTLDNGLTLAFSAGDVDKNDTFTVTVSDDPVAVDPTKAFNGTGADDPKFDPGSSVGTGSFQVNGETINVDATDSINSVLAKINASDAGVTATFDAVNEQIVFTQDTAGANQPISLTGDTSGFLAATKLSGAQVIVPRYTTLISGTEVNTATTSFALRGPTISGGSTSLATIGGVYDGTQGDDTLTFKIKNNATIGSGDKLKIEITDSNGDKIQDDIDFQSNPAGNALTLDNGVTLSFSAGDVDKNDTFTVDVYANTPTDVDPDRAFNGTRNADPEFDPGESVTVGSFDVNGITINVAADDTINAVLTKINAADAGVTATFSGDRVTLEQETAGSFKEIVLANDTSGFLSAVKLSSPTQIDGGNGFDADRVINTVAELSGISSGTFEINGTQISVDVTTDSLNDVVARIDAAGAGATAFLTQTTSSYLQVQSTSRSTDLILADGTSGFFSGLNVGTGSFKPDLVGSGLGKELEKALPFKQQVITIGRDLDAVFHDEFQGLEGELLDAVRDELGSSIKESFSKRLNVTGDSLLRSDFGIDFDFERDGGVFDLRGAALDRSIATGVDELSDFLFGSSPSGKPNGLVVSLVERIEALQETFGAALDSADGSGLLVDIEI